MVVRPLTSCITRWRLKPSIVMNQMAAPFGSIIPNSFILAEEKNNSKSKPGMSKRMSSSSCNDKGDKKCPPAIPPVPPEHPPGETCDETDVNFPTSGCKAMVMLNRPKQLNALNHCMARKISYMLQKWKCDKNLVLVRGFGNAFCAGGDVVAIAQDKTGSAGKNFFRDEFKLNALISTLPMPYVSLLNGIVMGGGVGISIHGKYRVATECSVFAMPETQIGFFPDVGVSYFLSRMPNNIGTFLGLTGYRIKAYDLVHLGIATHFCAAEKLCELEKELLCEDNKKSVEEILKHYHEESLKALCNSQVPLFTLEGNMPIIMSCFCADCMELIMAKLECDPCPFSKEILAILNKCSPLSLKITLRQIKTACCLDLFETLNMDFRIANRFMEGKDFFEGVRALLIDKDKNPKWQHQKVEEVQDCDVDPYFELLPPDQELCLPDSMNVM